MDDDGRYCRRKLSLPILMFYLGIAWKIIESHSITDLLL
jgi:hypothetical protein